MRRDDIDYFISILLIVALVITAILGYIQSEMELRKFYPHRYFAYATMVLAGLHLVFNFGKLWRWVKRKVARS